MAGTIVTDRIESDASYASSINIASPLVIANTITMANSTISGNVNIGNGTLATNQVTKRVYFGLGIDGNAPTTPTGTSAQFIVNVPRTGDTAAKTGLNITNNIDSDFQVIANAENQMCYVGPSAGSLGLKVGGLSNPVVRIDTSGRVTKPLQPSFFVSLTNSSAHIQSELVFTTLTTEGRHNNGNHYSASTGRFTAPVAGYYYFSYNIRVNNNVAYLHPCLKINGVSASHTLTIFGGTITGDTYRSCSASFILYLNASDYVSVASQGSGAGGTLETGQCSFAGCLLS